VVVTLTLNESFVIFNEKTPAIMDLLTLYVMIYYIPHVLIKVIHVRFVSRIKAKHQ